MATNSGVILGPDEGKVALVPSQKILHKVSCEDTCGVLSVEADTHIVKHDHFFNSGRPTFLPDCIEPGIAI